MNKIEINKGRVRTQNSKTLRVINALKEPDYKRKRDLDKYFIEKNKTPDFINNKKGEELDHILSRIDTGVEIEHMINGKVFNLKFDDSYFYINGEESSKSTSGTISTIMDDVNKSNYTLNDALENLSFEKKDLVKEMIMDEIVDFRDDVNKKEDIDMLDIGKLFDKYYDDNLGELDRIYNNFFGISKGLILPEEKIRKISNTIDEYGNTLRNGENEIGVYFMIVRVNEYCHSFVKIDDDNYECVYSYTPE